MGKASADVLAQARDREKAAAEVPSRAIGVRRQPNPKSGDMYYAISEPEERQSVLEDTTPCDEIARAVGGCQGIEVLEHRGDAMSTTDMCTSGMYLGTQLPDTGESIAHDAEARHWCHYCK